MRFLQSIFTAIKYDDYMKNPKASAKQTIGLFYFLSKLNRYLRSILQRINQAVIVVDGNSIGYSVLELFITLNESSFSL